MPMVSIYTTWKHPEISGFLIFSGGIKKMGNWEMSECNAFPGPYFLVFGLNTDINTL